MNPVKTFHIDSRGLVMEARGMEGTYVATSDYKDLLEALKQTEDNLRRALDENRAASPL